MDAVTLHPLDIESVYSSYCCCGEQDGSITKKTKTRKLTADFLEEFLENRFDVEEVAERGLLSEPLIEEVMSFKIIYIFALSLSLWALRIFAQSEYL